MPATATPANGPTADEQLLRSWQTRIFWLLWSAYAAYYLCRVNFAIAQPLILAEFPTWSKEDVGTIPSIYAIFYAIGQMVNGTLCARFGTRRMITIALCFAATTNLLFSFATSFNAMLVLWAINGCAQSAGWSLVIQTIANWTTSKRRGTVVGLISTCYTVGNVLSWLLAGQLCGSVGWRAAFWVPSLILFPLALVFYTFLRNSPVEAGLPPVRDDVNAATPAKDKTSATTSPAELSTGEILRITFSNRILWILGIGFFCMNAVRYSFMNWSVQYMADFQGRTIKGSAFTAVAIPLIGSLGAITAGWMSDTLFNKRRAPVCAIMQVGLAIVCVCFTFVPQGHWIIATAMLGLAGFMIYGPDMLMSGAATIDVSHPRAASIATGFTMCLGALGSSFSGRGIGWILDLEKGNWNLVFYVLAGLVLVAAGFMVSIWNARPKGVK